MKESSLVSCSRPTSYWDVAVAHLPWALLAGIAWILPYVADLDDLPLIPCTFHTLTGYPCPFCGLTRSFWAMGRGEWTVAVQIAPLGLLVYAGTVFLFAWHSTALLMGIRIRSMLARLLRSPWALWLVGLAVLLHWAYRIWMALP